MDDAVKTIVGCGKGILGTKRKVKDKHGRTYDDDIEKLPMNRKNCVS